VLANGPVRFLVGPIPVPGGPWNPERFFPFVPAVFLPKGFPRGFQFFGVGLVRPREILNINSFLFLGAGGPQGPALGPGSLVGVPGKPFAGPFPGKFNPGVNLFLGAGAALCLVFGIGRFRLEKLKPPRGGLGQPRGFFPFLGLGGPLGFKGPPFEGAPPGPGKPEGALGRGAWGRPPFLGNPFCGLGPQGSLKRRGALWARVRGGLLGGLPQGGGVLFRKKGYFKQNSPFFSGPRSFRGRFYYPLLTRGVSNPLFGGPHTPNGGGHAQKNNTPPRKKKGGASPP